MKFSEEFNVDQPDQYDWFDPILNIDTEVFIDPFLIYDNEKGNFVGSHDEVVKFFESVFTLLATSNGDKMSMPWKRAHRLLLFPEVEELCLGYAGASTSGSGSGKGAANNLSAGLWEAISQGVNDIRHFEQVQLFQAGIGPDRISDATAGILRHRFAEYTEKVARDLKLPTRVIQYGKAIYVQRERRWQSREYQLPFNRFNKKPILLCPKRYIRQLPTINSNDYWQYCFDNENEIVRAQFGEDIARNVNKEKIIELARNHPDTRERYLDFREDEGTEPYDFANDPKGVFAWYDKTKEWAANNPQLIGFTTDLEFTDFVSLLVDKFQNFVENHGGWSLLWNDNETPKPEPASQFLFHGIVRSYCEANDIDISKEPNIGRGPVDFKVSSGFKQRALIEVKLAKNSKFWNGLKKQLPKYLQAEEVKDGRFLVIVLTDKDLKKLPDIKAKTEEVSNQTGYRITTHIVDARRNPLSASRL